jgi:hypothetical protein
MVPARAWYRKKRSWIIASGIILLMLLILVFLPYGIQFGLADFLKQHGARQVEIQNIDFNPFTGRLLFQGVTADSGDGQRLQLERLELVLGWRDLFSKRAHIQAIDMQGLQAAVDVSDPTLLRVSGLSFPLEAGSDASPPEPASEKRPWGFALDKVELRETTLNLRQDDLNIDLELERLSLLQVISWQMQVMAQLTLEARINSAPLKAELQAGLFDQTRRIEGTIALDGFELKGLQPLLTAGGGPEVEGSLSLQQALKLSLSPTGALQWESDGSLMGDRLNLDMAQLQSKELVSHWQGKSKGNWSGQQGLQLQLEGQLEGALPQIALPEQSLNLSLTGYQWRGKLDLTQAAPGETTPVDGERESDQTSPAALSIRQQGELALNGLSLLRHRLLTDLSSLKWKGDVSLEPAEESPAISAEGEASLAGLQLSEQTQKGHPGLVGLRQSDFTGVKLVPGNQVTLSALRLQGIRLDDASGDKADPLLLSESLSLKDISFEEASGLAVALIEQQGLQARLALDEKGRLNVQRLLERLQAAAAPAAAAGEAESKAETATTEPLPIKIDRLVLQGKNRAQFTDMSVKPAFQMALDVKQFRLSNIDSSRPGQASPFSLEGSTGRHAELRAEGEITLFQSDPSGQLKGQLKGVELVPLSSYTIPAIGYHLESGELDADIDLALEKGNLNGNNHLIIRRLDVSQADEAQAEKLKQQIAMPLDSALGMLQDKNQTIDLNLPISGKLSDPNVELGDVINTALGNALKKGAMTYLTTALFPYGTMVALLKMAGEEAAAVQLAPVEFEPAAALLDDKDRDYLGKVAQVLQERPKIAIKLCGAATETDRQGLLEAMARQAKAEKTEKADNEKPEEGTAEETAVPEVPESELLALAKKRAEAIEDYLVKQHGVSASRAAVCRPALDPDESAVPRVDLQI